ncbi:proton-conducting transporter transmembrane domain-containing protein [Bythopirellula polymerisocia]|uniref:Probable inorganic carbon transporter subunit DabB n=1 Tax=Bythopirellula polymerisocia TaxID=2528003 RepID=A0A5C6D420_9BACT|nr:proton-conducting transporter membrane subunit [Bythopirellula polymerisocia]TWU29996.1 NADH-quinone oxidoreductase subunit L [Bythopirellula polymerisocia]
MIPTYALLIFAPLSLLLLSGLVPSQFANQQVARFRQIVLLLAGLLFLSAVASTAWWAIQGSWSWTLIDGGGGKHFMLSLHFDGISALMYLMVSFIGLVVCQYSVRYLDGEVNQGSYFRWFALTLGAVSMMVVSGNLLLFVVAWVLTSTGLHHLLLHYPERAAAQRAAWTKFAISRLGDVFLISALYLVFATFGTFELSEIFSVLRAPSAVSEESSTALVAIAWLLCLGAVTKSAQFPFHTWLPQTMETPTPVSALMHAGIVNAGGYLVIRMSPLISHSSSAMSTLAVIGATTACLGSIVMLTQPSVKRALAFSTIAQMGFMMLQCGLGAFSAAMLHILAHSLYKAHAFLSSGSVLQQSQATRGVNQKVPGLIWGVVLLVIATLTTVGSLAAITMAIGLNITEKPGGPVLALILCLALTTWGWRVLSARSLRTTGIAILGIAGLSMFYVLSYLAVDKMIASSLPEVLTPGPWSFVGPTIAAGFCLLFGVHWLLVSGRGQVWFAPLYVHASNGFYLDTLTRRLATTRTNNL